VKILLMSILLLGSFTSFADVITKESSSRINVIKEFIDDEEFIKFEFCQADDDCKFLGPSEYYATKELKRIRFKERMQVSYSSGAAAFMGAGAAFITFIGVAIEVPAISAWTMYTLVSGAGFGVGVGFPAIASKYGRNGEEERRIRADALNPFEQWEQQHTLSNTVISDEDYLVEQKEDLLNFVSRLDLVLNKLD